MKTIISTLAIMVALSAATFAQSKIENRRHSTDSHFSFSEQLKNRPSQNKNLREEAKTKMINDSQFVVQHNADTLTTWSWDEYAGDFIISNRKYYVYENGNPVEVIKETPSESGYVLSGRESFSYNDQNLLTESVLYYFDPNLEMWQEHQKFEFIYNNEGVQIKEIHSNWSPDINNWEVYYKFKEEYTYDSNNNLTKIEAYFWSLFSGLDQYLPSYMDEFVYDDLGRKSLSILSTPSGLEFELSQMEEYHYQGDNIMPEYVYIHNMYDGIWELEYKFANLSWYKFEDNLIESMTIYTNEEWDDDWKSDSEWHELFRYSFQYHPANDMRIILMEEVFFWDEWHPVYREIIELNELLYITRYEEQFYWDAWETDYGFDYKWRFNENNQPEDLTIMFFDSWEGDFWQYFEHYTFGYYTEPETVGVDNIYPDNLATIYPNPANSHFNVVLDSGIQSAEISIYNIVGKQVYNANLSASAGQQAINISNLPQGLYLVKVNAGKDQQVVKMLKK